MFAPSSLPWACEHILSGMVPADLKGENNPMGEAGKVMKEGKQEGDKDAAAASTKVGRHIQVVFEEADILKRSRGDVGYLPSQSGGAKEQVESSWWWWVLDTIVKICV